MDGQRFDELTLRFSAFLSRRRLGAALAVLGLGARLGRPDVADAKKKKRKKSGKKKRKKSGTPPGPPPGAPCQVSQGGDATVTTLAVATATLSLTTVERLPLDPTLAQTSTTTIRQAQTLVLQTTITSGKGQPTRIHTSYGPAFIGVKEVDFTSNGTTVSGSIDGRAIVPFPASAVPEMLQFQDGQPAPASSVSPTILQQLGQIYALAETTVARCVPAAASAQGADVGAENSASTSFKCLSCKGVCLAGSGACGYELAEGCTALAALCLFGAGACLAACLAVGAVGCTAAGLTCLDLCRDASFCCPVACGSEPDATCCDAGQTCLRPGNVATYRCCLAGETPCGGKNCCASPDRCMADGFCCNHPNIPCGQTCCGPLSRCCNGVCCRGVCAGDGSCCESPGVPCGRGCCSTDCCNNSACCPPGQNCNQAGQCAVLCPSTHTYCRPSGECCAPGSECCNLPGSSEVRCYVNGCVR